MEEAQEHRALGDPSHQPPRPQPQEAGTTAACGERRRLNGGWCSFSDECPESRPRKSCHTLTPRRPWRAWPGGAIGNTIAGGGLGLRRESRPGVPPEGHFAMKRVAIACGGLLLLAAAGVGGLLPVRRPGQAAGAGIRQDGRDDPGLSPGRRRGHGRGVRRRGPRVRPSRGHGHQSRPGRRLLAAGWRSSSRTSASMRVT